MKLLGNKVIIEILPKTTPSGIIIPDSANTPIAWRRGLVKALGTGIKPECTVKVGDEVLFQHGFEALDKAALVELMGGKGLFKTKSDLLIGSPDVLFAVI